VQDVEGYLEELQEGSEHNAFWVMLGGKSEYWKLSEEEGRVRLTEPESTPRVFVCHFGGQSTFSLMELPQYNQVRASMNLLTQPRQP
jgi:hypothetical protein